jgi:RHS repeat-associated protein
MHRAVRPAGLLVERQVRAAVGYDPYGKPTIYNSDWTAAVSWANSEQNEILYCGYRFDPETGLYNVRNRIYDYSLGRWLQRDPKGYVDGMGLYEYVGGCPLTHLDPTGMIRLITGNKDINDAYKGLSTTKAGKALIRQIERLEKRTGQEVLINITGQSNTVSHEGALRKGQAIFMVDADGKVRKIEAGTSGSLVEINPEHSVAGTSVATGDGPEDVKLGVPVDETLFHELAHSKQTLSGEEHGARKALPADSQHWSQEQKDQWIERWSNPQDYEAVMKTNGYRSELGRPLQARYSTTAAQNKRVEYLAERAKASGEYLPLHERPVFPYAIYNYAEKIKLINELKAQGKVGEADAYKRKLDEGYRATETARPNIPIQP